MLKPGLRLRSAVCSAEVMIIKGEGDGELTCGGQPMVKDSPINKATPDSDQMHGCLIGKRYVDENNSIEVLCVKTGEGSLYYSGEELRLKDTKTLPSSD